MNKNIRKLEDDLIELLNNSDVEIEAKRLIVRNVLYIIEKKANEVIMQELQEGDQEDVADQVLSENCVEELPEH